MAWLEPFIAAFPQWLAAVKNTSLFSSLNNEDNNNQQNPNQTDTIETNNALPNTHLSNITNNSTAIAMYQRAITLQQTNSDNMNKQIFEVEPIIPVSNTSSDFECDSDSDISSFSYSLNNNNNNQNNSNNSGVLSEGEYIDLHSRLSFDELSSELYESDVDELPLWLHINRHEKETEIIINNQNTKLNDRDWRLLMKTIKDNKFEQICLTLNNIVLDEVAGHYIQKLSVYNQVKVTKLSIENAFFFTSNSQDKQQDLYMFTQNEGMLSDNDDENDLFLITKKRYFNFNSFCKSMLKNRDLVSFVITNSNLGDILSSNDDIKAEFMRLLSSHTSLKRINLSGNGICDGTIFSHSLFHRKIPLQYLNLSYNPIQKNEIKSIKWAATTQYISPLEFDINEFKMQSVFKNNEKRKLKFEMEPVCDIVNDIDDMEEQQFISSLFPINNSSNMQSNNDGGCNWIVDDKYKNNNGLNMIELGIEIKQNKLKKKKKMCEEFVYIPPENRLQQVQPGSDNNKNDHVQMSGQLMLRI